MNRFTEKTVTTERASAFNKWRVAAPACLLPLLLATGLQAQTVSVINAASFSAVVAPGSIVTIFGPNLTNTTASAPDASQPPTILGKTSVVVGGSAATLFYVSPFQINAVLATSTPVGTDTVTVTSPLGVSTGTVNVNATAAPGLFSLTGTGTHNGAIIDALTGRIGAFSTTSRDSATFLSLFLTGANFSSPPVVLIGGTEANVTYAGPSPCCAGLQQINVSLSDSIAGAGRVPVLVKAGGQVSNVVEIVLLPKKGEGEFDEDEDNHTRNRELSSIATIPGTSLALVGDENDDVIREIDVSSKKVIHTIALAEDAEATAIAVNSSGTLAFVTERGRARVAVISLTSLNVKSEIPVGAGPVSIALSGNKAVVVNGDANSVTIFDTTTFAVTATVAVGSGARGVAADALGHAWVTNQNDGTISVLDLTTGKVTSTLNLGAGIRPAAIQLLAAAGFAVVADPATSADGKVLVVNLASGATTVFNVNPAHTGGSSDIVVVGNTAYIANQTGGSISILPLTITGGVVTGTVTTVKIKSGMRALAFDAKDNLILAVNESAGNIVLLSVASNSVVGTIKAVVSESENDGNGGKEGNDHSDHDRASNTPKLISLSPASGRLNSTLNLTMTGTGLQGATNVIFISPAGNIIDSAITVSGISAASDGKQVTATVKIAATDTPGVRVVRILTINGATSASGSAAVFTVIP